MLRYILVYGAIPGTIVILAMIIGFALTDGAAPATSQWVGFLIMFVAFSLIFVGVKRYRDKEKGGVVKFLPALGLGVAMAAISGVMYVVIWEIYLAVSDGSFIETYAAVSIEAKRAAGVSGEALESHVAHMEMMTRNYANPLFRVPVTFLEIFPVGLLVALVSAAVLRNPKAFPARA